MESQYGDLVLSDSAEERLERAGVRDDSNEIRHSEFDGGWKPPVLIPDQTTKDSPAMSEFAGLLHMVHLGNRSNRIWHTTFNGSRWTTNIDIPDQTSKAPPALATFGGRLHMVHLGNSSNQIWHSTFDGTRWTPNVRVPDQTSKAPPALATFGGRLYMVHVGSFSSQLWLSTLNGRTWSPNVKIPGHYSNSAPALAPLGNRLHIVYIAAPTVLGEQVKEEVAYSSSDGSDWSSRVILEGHRSKVPPTLTPFGPQLHLLHLGPSTP